VNWWVIDLEIPRRFSIEGESLARRVGTATLLRRSWIAIRGTAPRIQPAALDGTRRHP
jgi:hypothetical protein